MSETCQKQKEAESRWKFKGYLSWVDMVHKTANVGTAYVIFVSKNPKESIDFQLLFIQIQVRKWILNV